MTRVGILSVASASPEHEITQDEAKRFARGFFSGYFERYRGERGEQAVDRLLRAYDNAGVERRQLGRPVEWFEDPHGFAEKNAMYVEQALLLARKSGAAAIERAGLDPREYGGIVFASTTGISTPSLDARITQDLGLRRDVARMPLWGLGCAGGGAGLARARELAIARQQPILLIACELCSLTFVHGDRRRANLIAVALFGDGAAAVSVAPEPYWKPDAPQGPELLAPYSRLLPDTEDLMGWDVEPGGLRVRFSPKIPGVVDKLGPELVTEAASLVGLPAEALTQLIVHPGGAKVLNAYDRALELDPQALRHARSVLRDHGNMSSPTVLFVLERFLAEARKPLVEHGLLLGLGPGFCAEGVVFRW